MAARADARRGQAPAVPEVIARRRGPRAVTRHVPVTCPDYAAAALAPPVLAVSIDGYVRLFLPWLTFEARRAVPDLVASCSSRHWRRAARRRRPGTRRACTSSTSGAAAGRGAAALHPASTGHSGDSGLVAGRRSRGVAGHYTAESALRLMLGDSGLQARTARRTRSRSPWRRPRRAGRDAARAAALLRQAAGRHARAACGDPDACPGSYRAAVSLWFGDSGQVARAPAGFHGFARARPAADAAAGTIETGRGRAAGRGQPITFVIRPGRPRPPETVLHNGKSADAFRQDRHPGPPCQGPAP